MQPDPFEALEHRIRPGDHALGDRPLVMHPDIRNGSAHDQAVAADVAEHPGKQLVAAGAVVRVEQHDLVGLGIVDLPGMAHADHVLGEAPALLVPHPCLADP
jgi:glycine cleavage system pyridoxal-binding protein P